MMLFSILIILHFRTSLKRGFYEERKELDRNMEEIFQRLSFWTSLEKSNRYLILKEVENALALFELHHQDQVLTFFIIARVNF